MEVGKKHQMEDWLAQGLKIRPSVAPWPGTNLTRSHAPGPDRPAASADELMPLGKA